MEARLRWIQKTLKKKRRPQRRFMDAAKEDVQSSGVPEKDDRKADDLMW